MEPLLPLAVSLPKRGSRTLLRDLHRQLREAIVDGRLRSGVRLPSTRGLAKLSGVSRNTAIAAYQLLLSEGYIVSRRGSGTRVAHILPAPATAKRAASASRARPDSRLGEFWVRRAVELARRPMSAAGVPHPFRVGVPETKYFPHDAWRRQANRVSRSMLSHAIHDADLQGEPDFRDAIARYVSFTRAVACSAEDIVVTSGAKQAFDLLARVLVKPRHTCVTFEDPGFPPARAAFAAAGARVASVPVDSEGLCVEQIPQQARVIYVTPSHQFPLGMVMSARRRADLLRTAQVRNAVIIEDDYDGEFRFTDRPLDALQTLDRTESVFYVGTFSKSLLPALRLGYIVAPSWARAALVAAKATIDGYCGPHTQNTVAALVRGGFLSSYVRKMHRVYGRRRAALLSALREDFARWLDPVPSAAGLHVAALFRKPYAESMMVARAREAGIGLNPLSAYSAGPKSWRGVMFGYGVTDEAAIGEGLSRLHRAWR